MSAAGQAYRATPPPEQAADWQWLGSCRGSDPELFYPPDLRNSRAARGWAKRAKAVCKPCRVRRPCLAAALQLGEQGVWGGLTEGEREELLAGTGGDVDRAVEAETARRGGYR